MSDRLAELVGQHLASLLDQRQRELVQAYAKIAQLELLVETQTETINQLQPRDAWGDQPKENS